MKYKNRKRAGFPHLEAEDIPIEIVYEDEESADFCEWDPDDYECQQERYNQW
jgi:hypothetical protein